MTPSGRVTELERCGCHAQVDLDEIVSRSGLKEVPVPRIYGWSRYSVVNVGGRQCKVRAYSCSQAAVAVIARIRPVATLFSHCYGRLDRFLVWEYVPHDCRHDPDPPWVRIGRFMIAAARVRGELLTERDVEEWLDMLGKAGFFMATTLRRIREVFGDGGWLPAVLNLEYLDATPANFGWLPDRRFVAIDEKHLRFRPWGAGLAKRWCTPGGEYTSAAVDGIEDVYRVETTDTRLWDPSYRRFVVLCYCLAPLAANARYVLADGTREAWLQNTGKRSNWWRRRRVHEVISLTWWRRFREDVAWLGRRCGRVARSTGQRYSS